MPNTSASSILSVLNPRIASDPTLLRAIGEAIMGERLVVLSDAFEATFAERVATGLPGPRSWAPHHHHDPSRPYFQYHRHIPTGDVPVLRDAARILGSAATKSMMSSLTGLDCEGAFGLECARYNPGDYSYPHNDDGGWRSIS